MKSTVNVDDERSKNDERKKKNIICRSFFFSSMMRRLGLQAHSKTTLELDQKTKLDWRLLIGKKCNTSIKLHFRLISMHYTVST